MHFQFSIQFFLMTKAHHIFRYNISQTMKPDFSASTCNSPMGIRVNSFSQVNMD